MNENPYETGKLLNEYLLFHYGEPDEVLPWSEGPRGALGYPVRCVAECLDVGKLARNARALDVGCAVGRSAFELARHCPEVIGIDFSHSFAKAASILASEGSYRYFRADEGDHTTPLVARVPEEIDRKRVRFEQGDAHEIGASRGAFDVVLAANLIDRLAAPRKFLAQLPRLVKTGGQLIISSPCTWLRDYTAQGEWLCGFAEDGSPFNTLESLKRSLAADFELTSVKDLPFLLREHARKYQWSVAQATVWMRKSND